MSLFKNIVRGLKGRVKSLKVSPYKEVNLNWPTIKYYKHLPAGKIREHLLFGKPLYFASPAELLHGLKEIFLEKIYKQQFAPAPLIIDCGANIGMSVIYFKRLAPDAQIIAFEPDETNYDLLSKNINSFRLSDVTLLKKAAWNATETLSFSSEGSMSSKIEKPGTLNTVKVEAARLKDYIDKEIDFLKIDIEGAEYAVLKDIAPNLGFVKNMFIEYHGVFSQNKELAEIIQIISESGFHFYIKEAAVLFDTPFYKTKEHNSPYDVQLNIFCFKDPNIINQA